MNTKKLFTILLFAGSTIPAASADHYGHHHGECPPCIEDQWIRLDSTSETTFGPCKVSEPLELSVKEQSYPLMRDNPYTVKYWKGSFEQASITKTKTTYLHEVYNRCIGKTLISEQKVIPTQDEEHFSFKLDNPNLHDDVNASYLLLPMTDEEAASAFDKAKSDCESYSPDQQK